MKFVDIAKYIPIIENKIAKFQKTDFLLLQIKK